MGLVVIVPTYNEVENIDSLLAELLALAIDGLEVLVVDDDSPDGTAERVRAWGERDGRVCLLLRKNQRGRGSAGVDGFKMALERGAWAVVEMDADGSHAPAHLPRLIEDLSRFDLVIGSRLVAGGSDARGLLRRLITAGANAYLRLLLGLPVRDATSGFRAYRAEVLRAIDLESLDCNGPAILQQVLVRAHRMGFSVGETPIHFVDRQAGRSTFNAGVALSGLAAAIRLRFRP